MNIPEGYRLVASAEQVDEAVQSIAEQIINDFPDSRDLLFISLLRGSEPFATKLMFSITDQSRDYHPDMAHMIVDRYRANERGGTVRIKADLPPEDDTPIQDRTVIILDDVLDEGVTAEFVSKHALSLGARAVEIAVLCNKDIGQPKKAEAKYVGFNVGDQWLVGMGMDDPKNAGREGYRWINEIWERDLSSTA